jgi:diaminopimelate epimerase
MKRVRFAKMHGAGNDFVMIDCLAGDPVAHWGEFARFALDRHFGIGGDQLLLARPSACADFRMDIYNADGSRAQMCGNGIRAFACFVRDRGLWRGGEQLRVETLAGVVTPRFVGPAEVEIEMTRPVFHPEEIPTTLSGRGSGPLLQVPLEVAGERLDVTALSMGNPHCVLFVEDPETAPVTTLGPAIEHHPAFPQRTNVEFVTARSPQLLEQRTWERGAGETLACGSGACAAAVAAMLAGKAERSVRIRLRGGELQVRWPDPGGPVWLRGPAAHVFEGEVQLP